MKKILILLLLFCLNCTGAWYSGGLSYIDYGEIDNLDFGANDVATIMAWVYRDTDLSAEYRAIVTNGNGGVGYNFHIYCRAEGAVQHGIAFAGNGEYYFNYVLPFQTWTHIALVRPYTNGYWNLYVNGEYEEVATEIRDFGNVTSTTTKVGFGGYNDPLQYWIGGIADVRVYKWVLSADEIKQCYGKTACNINEFPTEPAVYWKLDEFSGGSRDSGPNGEDAIQMNGGYWDDGPPVQLKP